MQILMLGPDLLMAVLAVEIRLFAQRRYLLVLALVAVLLASLIASVAALLRMRCFAPNRY